MDCTYKGVGGRGGVDDGKWAAGGKLYLLIRLFGASIISPRSPTVIGLDKPRGPKRHLTKTEVNIRTIPPI